MNKQKLGFILLLLLGTVSVCTLVSIDPIKQNEAYHEFSDTDRFFGISNFWNVVSNLPFLLVGVFGLLGIKKMKRKNLQFIIFFASISFVAFGSGYYHFYPNSGSLILDRLPMTVAFTSLISIIVSEFINQEIGEYLLFPLVILGAFSILFWISTGDLRLYVFVQFFSMIAALVILLCFKSQELHITRGFFLLLIAYVIAKIFETFDHEIHNAINLSGHTLKHIAAAIGIFLLIKQYLKQQRIFKKRRRLKRKN